MFVATTYITYVRNINYNLCGFAEMHRANMYFGWFGWLWYIVNRGHLGAWNEKKQGDQSSVCSFCQTVLNI